MYEKTTGIQNHFTEFFISIIIMHLSVHVQGGFQNLYISVFSSDKIRTLTLLHYQAIKIIFSGSLSLNDSMYQFKRNCPKPYQ